MPQQVESELVVIIYIGYKPHSLLYLSREQYETPICHFDSFLYPVNFWITNSLDFQLWVSIDPSMIKHTSLDLEHSLELFSEFYSIYSVNREKGRMTVKQVYYGKGIFSNKLHTYRNVQQRFDFRLPMILVKLFYKPYFCFNFLQPFFNT